VIRTQVAIREDPDDAQPDMIDFDLLIQGITLGKQGCRCLVAEDRDGSNARFVVRVQRTPGRQAQRREGKVIRTDSSRDGVSTALRTENGKRADGLFGRETDGSRHNVHRSACIGNCQARTALAYLA